MDHICQIIYDMFNLYPSIFNIDTCDRLYRFYKGKKVIKPNYISIFAIYQVN